jgi:ABC-type Fe3+-hydroxamate transport system substrate-binding protein
MSFINQPLQVIPQRIVSLVPSQTELLFDLGLEEETVGITKFCVHPESWFRSKTRVGGTKSINIDKIKALKPDLILANKEENVKDQIEALTEIAPVWVSDIRTLEDGLEMIRTVGKLTDRFEKADIIAKLIQHRFEHLQQSIPQQKQSTLYLIWRNPWMSIGQDTFIHHIMQTAGLNNVCGDQTRYPELTDEQIIKLNPSLILLSSEPYPFKEKHIAELQSLLPQAKILLVDGELFSWYGSRLLHTPPYLEKLIIDLKK